MRDLTIGTPAKLIFFIYNSITRGEYFPTVLNYSRYDHCWANDR